MLLRGREHVVDDHVAGARDSLEDVEIHRLPKVLAQGGQVSKEVDHE